MVPRLAQVPLPRCAPPLRGSPNNGQVWNPGLFSKECLSGTCIPPIPGSNSGTRAKIIHTARRPAPSAPPLPVQCEIIQGRPVGKLLEPSFPRRVMRVDLPEQQAQL